MTSIVQGKRISAYSLSPDGSHVAYTSPERFERPGSQQVLFDLAVAELSTNQGRVIASHVRLDYDGGAFSWSPDGKWIGFHTGGMEERVYDCYAVNINHGGSRNVTMFSPLEHAVATTPRRRSGIEMEIPCMLFIMEQHGKQQQARARRK